MGLESPGPWLVRARQEGWAVPACAAYNLETVKALIATADRLGSPIFLQTTWSTVTHAGLPYIAALTKLAASTARVPVFLHLDHGHSLDEADACLRAGYTSLMIDGSALPWADNVALTQAVARLAHVHGVPVEAELGRIPGVEEDLSVSSREASLTDPVEAARFVAETGADSLAVSIGTAHGLYRLPPALDVDRVRQIHAAVAVPLVLHGASGVPDDQVRAAIAAGMSKINIASELKWAFQQALASELLRSPQETDPRKYFTPAVAAYSAMAEAKIRLAGAVGRAAS